MHINDIIDTIQLRRYEFHICIKKNYHIKDKN